MHLLYIVTVTTTKQHEEREREREEKIRRILLFSSPSVIGFIFRVKLFVFFSLLLLNFSKVALGYRHTEIVDVENGSEFITHNNTISFTTLFFLNLRGDDERRELHTNDHVRS